MTYATDLFDGLLADVITLTARPDLEAETALALRTATNNAHFSDAYPRDVQTQVIQLVEAGYAESFDLPTLFPRLRGISSVKLLDINYQPVIFTPENAIQIIELSDVYDSYGALRSNVAYIAGDKLHVRTAVASYGFLVEWFKAPSTRRVDYSSWIAQLYPDVIIYWAASIVLSTNGNEEKANKYMTMTVQLHIPYLKANFLLGELR